MHLSVAELSRDHAHVLAMLLGRGDEHLTAEVPRKLDAKRVTITGMRAWPEVEGEILGQLGVRHTPADAITDSSN